MPTVEKIAENAWLKLLGRGIMVLAVPLFMWILGYLNGLSTSVNTLTTQVDLSKLRTESNTIAINELKTSLTNLDQRTILILQSVARLEAAQAAQAQIGANR